MDKTFPGISTIYKTSQMNNKQYNMKHNENFLL